MAACQVVREELERGGSGNEPCLTCMFLAIALLVPPLLVELSETTRNAHLVWKYVVQRWSCSFLARLSFTLVKLIFSYMRKGTC